MYLLYTVVYVISKFLLYPSPLAFSNINIQQERIVNTIHTDLKAGDFHDMFERNGYLGKCDSTWTESSDF